MHKIKMPNIDWNLHHTTESLRLISIVAQKYHHRSDLYIAQVLGINMQDLEDIVKIGKKKLEEASEQYILEYFDEKFTEKYGQELEAIEEKVITGLDKYLEYNINEKIGPEMIQKTALQETCQPIVEEFIHILEDRYVAPNTTGSKRIRELKAENAEIRSSLQKQLDENMRLAE